MYQNLLFYTVSGTIIGAAMQWAGMGLMMVFVGSLLLPPILLIVWRIAKYNNLV